MVKYCSQLHFGIVKLGSQVKVRFSSQSSDFCIVKFRAQFRISSCTIYTSRTSKFWWAPNFVVHFECTVVLRLETHCRSLSGTKPPITSVLGNRSQISETQQLILGTWFERSVSPYFSLFLCTRAVQGNCNQEVCVCVNLCILV